MARWIISAPLSNFFITLSLYTTHANYICLQQQYEFIHCGLSELVVCGETEVAAANLRIDVNNLKKMGEDGMTGFQKQMKVWQFMRLWVYNCINC